MARPAALPCLGLTRFVTFKQFAPALPCCFAFQTACAENLLRFFSAAAFDLFVTGYPVLPLPEMGGCTKPCNLYASLCEERVIFRIK